MRQIYENILKGETLLEVLLEVSIVKEAKLNVIFLSYWKGLDIMVLFRPVFMKTILLK